MTIQSVREKLGVQKLQRQTGPSWADEEGNVIPRSRIRPDEKLMEKHSIKIANTALDINARMAAFKEELVEMCDEVYQESLNATGTDGKDRKGNFTWYNFDRTVKIEVDVKDRIEFDDLKIQACKEKLDEFIQNGTKQVDDFLRTLIMSAFEKSKGALDVKKVLALRKHRERTKNPLYLEAMDLLDQAIRRPSSRRYFRAWLKNSEGKWVNIDLNFTSI